MRKQAVNTLSEGMFQDINVQNMPNNVLTDSLNSTVITNNANERAFQNDMGNTRIKNLKGEYVSLSAGYIPLAVKEYGNVIFIISGYVKNDKIDRVEIGSYPSVNQYGEYVDDYNPFYNLTNSDDQSDLQAFNVDNTTTFKFTLHNPIQIECTPEYDRTINLIITDGINTPKLVNNRFSLENGILKVNDRNETSDTNIYPNPDKYGVDEFNNSITLQMSGKNIPKLELTDVNFNYGNLKCGNYTCYFKYVDIDGNESPFIAESGPVSIAIGQDEGLRGGFEDEVATKSISFKLTNLDSGQKYIRVYYIRNTSGLDGTTVKKYVKVLDRFDIIDNQCVITLTGYEDTADCTSADINMQYNIIDSAETEVVTNNVLFFGNVKQNSNVDYQELKQLSKQIKASPVVKALTDFELSYKNFKEVDNEIVAVKNYRNPVFSYYNTGYQFNEYYRFGVVYIFENGDTSSVFDISGNIPLDGKSLNDKGVVKINNFLNTTNGQHYKLDEINEFKNIFAIHFDITNDIIAKLKKQGVKGYFFVRQKRMPIKQATGFSIDWDYQSGLPCVDRTFETPFVCNLFWGRSIQNLYPNEDGLDNVVKEKKTGSGHNYKYITRYNDRYCSLTLSKFITQRILPEGSWSKSAAYLTINSSDAKDITPESNQKLLNGISDRMNGLLITKAEQEKIANYFPELTDLSKIKYPELPAIYDLRYKSRQQTYGDRAIGWNKYGYSHLIYEFNQYKARYVNPHVLLCPEYDVDPGKINTLFVGNDWYLKRKYVTKNCDEGYFYRKNTIDTACWDSSDWWSKTSGISASRGAGSKDGEEGEERAVNHVVTTADKKAASWTMDVTNTDVDDHPLSQLNTAIDFNFKDLAYSKEYEFFKDKDYYKDIDTIDFNVDLYQYILTPEDRSYDVGNGETKYREITPEDPLVYVQSQKLIGNIQLQYNQAKHITSFKSGYYIDVVTSSDSGEAVTTETQYDITPKMRDTVGCAYSLSTMKEFLPAEAVQKFYGANTDQVFPQSIYVTSSADCTSAVINRDGESDDQAEEFGRLLKVHLNDLQPDSQYFTSPDRILSNMSLSQHDIFKTKLVAVNDGHKNVNVVTNAVGENNPIYWSFNAIAGAPEQREQSGGFSSVFQKLNGYYLFDANKPISDDQGTEQYHDPKDPLCCIGLKDYKGDAGDTEKDASKKYYKMHRTNLVRGLWYPYIGCTERLTRDCIYDVYSKEITATEEDIAKVRSQLRYPYFTISDRYDLNDDNDNTCYRGDSYICLFTHRLNRNFQGATDPVNDTIVDIDTYRYYSVETNSVAVPYSAYSKTAKDGTDITDKNALKKGVATNYPNVDDLNAVRLGRWVEFPCISSQNLNIRTLNMQYTSEQGLTGLKRGFYPYYPISTAGNTKIPESGCRNDGYNVSTGDKAYVNNGDISFMNSDYTNRVLYSNIHVNDSFVNGNRVFISDNAVDYTKKYGKIIKLEDYYNKIYVIMEHGVGVLPLNEKYLTGSSGENNVYVKSGNLIPSEMTILSDTYGSLYKDSVIKTQYGIYGIDSVKKVIWRCGQDKPFETLSDATIKSFLLKHLDNIDGNVTLGVKNIKTHYNKLKGDVMFTFYDYTDDQVKPWNLCYNEYTQKFTTFYSWIPSVSENIGNTFLTFDNNTTRRNIALEASAQPFLYKHGTNHLTGAGKIKPCYWYDEQHPFEFEFVVTGEGVHKIFDNLQILSNNAEPESFHYEIIGDCFDFAPDKQNAYVRQELIKRVYNTATDDDGNEIPEKLYVKDADLELLNEVNQNRKSVSFPLYYSRVDHVDDLKSDYQSLTEQNKDYRYLAGTEVTRDDLLDEYHLVTHVPAVDVDKTDIIQGNMRYTEDKWNVVINPINVVYKNEREWRKNHIPISINNAPTPNINNKRLNFSIPDELSKRGYDQYDIDYSRWNDGNAASFMNTREQVDQRDKWIKIRIRYSGKKLAIIHQILTEYRISYA